MATPKSPADEAKQPADGLKEDLVAAFQGVHLHLDKIDAGLKDLHGDVRGPARTTPETLPLPRVARRRTQDEMALALRRLLSPDPRPRDDDSPQVVEDCFAEVLNLRQLTSELMQTLTGSYQHGLAQIRQMTER